MYYYFTCNYNGAIKINGIYYGTLCQTVKCLNIDGDFEPLVEICALDGGAQNVNFILSKQFISCPPDNVYLTDLKGGYLVKINQPPMRTDFQVLNQQKTNNAIVTVFNDNGSKISIETQQDFFAETLNLCVEKVEISEFYLENDCFVCVQLKGEKSLLLVYHLSKPIRKVFCREVDDFSTKPTFTTIENLNDIAKHVVTSTWNFVGGELKLTMASCTHAEDFDAQKIPEQILPFAFFEHIFAGDNFEIFLCENLKQHAKKLRGFLGDFIGIIPPPKFRNIDEVGLIYKKSEREYFAEYFTVLIENGKITNIKKSD